MCEESAEASHDDNEKQAMYAIMYAAASRGKGKKGKLPSMTDLYDRNKATDGRGNDEKTIQDVMEKQRHAQEWLSNFDLASIVKREEDE